MIEAVEEEPKTAPSLLPLYEAELDVTGNLNLLILIKKLPLANINALTVVRKSSETLYFSVSRIS